MRPKNDVTNPNPSQHLAHCDPTYHLRCAKPYKLVTRFIPNQCGTQTYIKCLKHTHTPTQNPSNPRPTTWNSIWNPQSSDLKPTATNLKTQPHRSETHSHLIWNPLPRRSKTTATQSRSWERILTVRGREERAWDRKEKRLRREESEKWEQERECEK